MQSQQRRLSSQGMHNEQDNYEPWTGRNQTHGSPDVREHLKQQQQQQQQYFHGADHHASNGSGDSPNIGEASYFAGQKFANETQDRPSIISKSGYVNINDMTGITRGGEIINKNAI